MPDTERPTYWQVEQESECCGWVSAAPTRRNYWIAIRDYEYLVASGWPTRLVEYEVGSIHGRVIPPEGADHA